MGSTLHESGGPPFEVTKGVACPAELGRCEVFASNDAAWFSSLAGSANVGPVEIQRARALDWKRLPRTMRFVTFGRA